jgi:hypothetical protein
MDFAEELRVGLKDLFATGSIEIRESGTRTTPLPPLSWEVRGASSKPLLHLWAGNCNVTRRVLAITDQSDERIMLAVERFGRAAPDRMEIVPPELSAQHKADFSKRTSASSQGECWWKISRTKPSKKVPLLPVSNILSLGCMRVALAGKAECAAPFLPCRKENLRTPLKAVLLLRFLWLERARRSNAKGFGSGTCLRTGDRRVWQIPRRARFARVDPDEPPGDH